jgi:hypothetical protein
VEKKFAVAIEPKTGEIQLGKKFPVHIDPKTAEIKLALPEWSPALADSLPELHAALKKVGKLELTAAADALERVAKQLRARQLEADAIISSKKSAPVDDAEKALKQLRQHPDDGKALRILMEAVKSLQEGAKPQPATKGPPAP